MSQPDPEKLREGFAEIYEESGKSLKALKALMKRRPKGKNATPEATLAWEKEYLALIREDEPLGERGKKLFADLRKFGED